MARNYASILALFLLTSGCEFERQESVGEELREAGNAMDDGWDAMKDEAGEVGSALTQNRSDTERRFDKATRDLEDWYQAHTKKLDQTGQEISDATQEQLDAIESDLKAVRADLEDLADVTDAEWEATKKDIDEQLTALGDAVDGIREDR